MCQELYRPGDKMMNKKDRPLFSMYLNSGGGGRKKSNK